MSARRFALIAIFVATAVCAQTASAASSSAEALEDARRLVDVELRFKEAIELLERALEASDLTREQRVEAYRLLGTAYVARNATGNAEAAFSALLAIDPAFELDPSLSPKIQRVFARVKEKAAQVPRILELSAVRNGDRVEFSARISDVEARLASVVLYARASGETYEEKLMTREGDRLRADVEPSRAKDWSRIEYYVVGRDASGSAVVRVSDAANPSSAVVEKAQPSELELAPAAGTREAPEKKTLAAALPKAGAGARGTVEEETPWYGTWWFWTIAIGAAGAGAAAIVLTRDNGGAPMGTLDPIELK